MWLPVLLTIFALHITGNLGLKGALPRFVNEQEIRDKLKSIREDQPVGKVIVTVNAAETEGRPITYSIGDTTYFQINDLTGELSLKTKWDYETTNADNWRQILTITAIDDELDQGTIDVESRLENINDNPPVFSRTLKNDHILENEAVGYLFMTVEVRDADQAANDYLNVICTNRDLDPRDDTCDVFTLQKLPSSNFLWNGSIILSRSLDYEKRKSYSIRLQADDGLHKVIQEFQIIVMDVNDSPPYYVRHSSHTLEEEVQVGTYIDYVSAVDSDDDAKRAIRYQLIGDAEALQYFSVSKTEGNITNLKVLDFDDPRREYGKEFTLIIRAMELLNSTTGLLGNDSTTTAETTINIVLKDVNDNCPEWEPQNYTVNLTENALQGTNLPFQLTLTDKDFTDIYRNFSLEMVDPTSTFYFSTAGFQTPANIFIKVINNTGIDYESSKKEYDLKIIAKDVSQPQCWNTANIKVQIQDINDETPTFILPPSNSYNATVPENATGGTSVIKVSANDKDTGLYGVEGFKFSILDHPENVFVIDERSGEVTVNACPTPGVRQCIDFEWQPSYHLYVMVKDNNGNDPTHSDVADLNIKILNVNDNAPQFLGNYTRRIMEGTSVPEPELLVQAVDKDHDNVTFELLTSRDANYWLIDEINGRIIARKNITLDDSINGIFNFEVKATDGKRETTAKVTIVVVDTNDNSPIFSKPHEETYIQEDYPPNTVITTVTVKDKDSPTSGNGKVDITIERGSTGKFTVKNLTMLDDGSWVADIYTEVDAKFDYDVQNQYILTLTARDKGIPPLTSSSTLTVNIIDINNKDPYIEPPTINAVVSENEAIGYLVTVVSAKDRDQDALLETYFGPTMIAYDPAGQRVTNPALYQNLFTIAKNGEVRVNESLNRDIVSVMEYSLLAVDTKPTPQQTGTGSLFIRILEYNDQDPYFEHPLYEQNIFEERDTGTFVISLLATDEDDQIGSYQLVGQHGNLFAIDINTGVVTVNGRLDYDASLFKVELVATAYDTGSPQRSNTTRVVINIININDNAPVFTKPIYEVYLLEHAMRTDSLIKVLANDADLGDFGVVQYEANDPYFIVNRTTGDVYLKSGISLDRELRTTYVFQVTAYDSPNDTSVRLNTTAQVYVILQDINDNCPIFQLGDSYSVIIIETAEVGDQVLDILATDSDDGINRSILFRIEDNTVEGREAMRLFSIQSRSPTNKFEEGRIEVLNNLRNQSGVYRFVVVASDKHGDNRTGDMCSSRANVTVTVVEAINNAPEWILPPSRNFSIDVLESQYKGMLVYNCHAYDKNKGKDGIVDYFFRTQRGLESQTDMFRINQVTGVISATAVYDREQVASYVLTVVAKDQGNPSASSEAVLIVNVLDVNDNEPEFLMRNGETIPYVWNVEEGKPANDVGVIGKVSATDRDIDHKNNKVYYRIVAGNDDGRFVLGRESGELMLNPNAINGLDRETKDVYRMDVLAYNDVSDDTVIRYKRSTNPSIVSVIITVKDSNDMPPQFVGSDYYGCVPKSAPFGQSILKVEAVDKDLSGSRYITYSKVQESTNNFFMIESSLGIVRNAKLLYNIDSNTPVVKIRVSDSKSSSDTEVKIFVTDKLNEVKLVVSQKPSDVRYYQDQMIRALVNTSADRPVNYVCIREIRDHVDENGGKLYTSSDVFLSAVYLDSDKYKLYEGSTLNGILASQLPKYESLHVTSVSVETEEKDRLSLKEDSVLAIFIIAILLIFLAIILFCLACCLIKNSKKKMKKLRAEVHRPPQVVMHQPAPEVAASVNPVYDNHGFVEDNEYAVVHKKRPAPAEKVAPPVVPVLVPALKHEDPQLFHQDPEPYIITEPIMTEDEPVMKPSAENFFTPGREFEEPLPDMETVIETEVPRDDEIYPYGAPEDEINVEFRDFEDSPSLRRSPSPPTPPHEEEYRIETRVL